MNIVCFIGNGFDLALGLDTSYASCIKAYCEARLNASDNCLRWLCEQMQNHGNDWSDAEKAFGKLKFSECVNCSQHKDTATIYRVCYTDFTRFFSSRIAEEERRLVIPPDTCNAMSEAFCEKVLRLDKFMETIPRKLCAVPFENGESIKLDFISLNYTKTLEQLINVPLNGDSYWITNKHIKVKVGKVCHAHGEIDSSNYVFGVDSPDQIVDDQVRAYSERRGGLLKSISTERVGLGVRNTAVQLINNADRIVLFGLSYGETDRSWWKLIYERVIKAQRAQLIICPYEKETFQGKISAAERADLRVDIIRKVFSSLTSEPFFKAEALETVQHQLVAIPSPSSCSNYDFLGLEEIKKRFVIPQAQETAGHPE